MFNDKRILEKQIDQLHKDNKDYHGRLCTLDTRTKLIIERIEELEEKIKILEIKNG